VESINSRSNSLYKYSLKRVVESTRGSDGSYDMVLEVEKQGKEERLKASVKPSGSKWHYVSHQAVE